MTSSARALRQTQRRMAARVRAARRQPSSGSPDTEDGSGGTGPPRGRTRLRWAVLATLPLVAAIVLGAGGLLRTEPSPTPDTAASSGSAPLAGLPGVPQVDAVTDGGPAALGSEAVDSGNGPRHDAPASGLASVEGAAAQESGAEPATLRLPEAPAGFQVVAVDPVDPVAAALVQPGDRVDVLLLDGTVAAQGVEVLDCGGPVRGSTCAGEPLLFAVPQDQAREVAAVVAMTDVTVLLSPSAEDAAPASTGPDR